MDATIFEDEFDTDNEAEPMPDQDQFDTMPVYSAVVYFSMKSFIRSGYPF